MLARHACAGWWHDHLDVSSPEHTLGCLLQGRRMGGCIEREAAQDSPEEQKQAVRRSGNLQSRILFIIKLVFASS